MLPLRDTIPSARVPIVTWLLIIVNGAVFLHELQIGTHLEALIRAYGLVPRHFSVATLLTSMFLHGGWLHLFGNMLYLYIFGDNVEDRLGHVRYLVLYLLCGMAAGSAQVLMNPRSGLPIDGASGAIAGVLGAYFLFFPQARVVTLVPIFLFLQVMEIPAVAYLLLWFVFQVFSGIGAHGSTAGGVAVWAHVGGFVAGMVLGPVLRIRRSPPPGEWSRAG